MAWLDNRTTSGSWRVATDFPNLPAWIVQGRRRHHHALVRRRPRFKAHEFKARPTTAASTAPTCWTGRSPWPTSRRTTTRPRTSIGVTHRTAARRCRPTTTTRCSPTAPSGSATTSTPPAATATNAEPYDGRPASHPGRLQLPGRQERVEVEHAVREIPRARGDRASSTCGPTATPCRSPTTRGPRRRACSTSTPTGNLHRQAARWCASPATRSRRRGCC